MSIICVLYLPDGIIMAADSRLTRRKSKTESDGSTTIEKFPLTDNAQKLLLLKKCAVGIAYWGTATINNQSIPDYIRDFELNEICENDSPENVADKLLAHGKDFPDTAFYVCGYYQDIPYVYLVDAPNKTRKNISSSNEITYSLSWAGETEALIKMINNDPVMVLNYNLMPLRDGIDFIEFCVDFTIKYQRFSDKLQTCGGAIDILALTKDGSYWHKHK